MKSFVKGVEKDMLPILTDIDGIDKEVQALLRLVESEGGLLPCCLSHSDEAQTSRSLSNPPRLYPQISRKLRMIYRTCILIYRTDSTLSVAKV
jgi:hypothetical protein